jgi:hypothetical protein
MTAPAAALVGSIHQRWLDEVERTLTTVGRVKAWTVCVGTFASRVLLPSRCDAAPSPEALVADFRKLEQRGSPSPIVDAVRAGVDFLVESRLPTRQVANEVIVVVTDGLNSGNVHRLAETAAYARRHSVTVHAVMTLPALWGTAAGETDARARAFLESLSAGTGGSLHFCERRRSGEDCSNPKGGIATLIRRVLPGPATRSPFNPDTP